MSFFNQTVTTLLPRVFPAPLKLSGVTALRSVPNVIISRSLVSGGNYFSAPFIPPASILIFNVLLFCGFSFTGKPSLFSLWEEHKGGIEILNNSN